MDKKLLSRTTAAKVTADEYADFEARAAAEGKTISSWVRDVLIAHVHSPTANPEICVVLGEVLALRNTVATLLFEASSRPPLTQKTINEILKLADLDKVQRAAELLKRPHGGM
jgi:hypothetical protein